jgi:hypothetical protein
MIACQHRKISSSLTQYGRGAVAPLISSRLLISFMLMRQELFTLFRQTQQRIMFCVRSQNISATQHLQG